MRALDCLTNICVSYIMVDVSLQLHSVLGLGTNTAKTAVSTNGPGATTATGATGTSGADGSSGGTSSTTSAAQTTPLLPTSIATSTVTTSQQETTVVSTVTSIRKLCFALNMNMRM
ncbi:unnamed protein product, partial [Didymodactylos carnosus]